MREGQDLPSQEFTERVDVQIQIPAGQEPLAVRWHIAAQLKADLEHQLPRDGVPGAGDTADLLERLRQRPAVQEAAVEGTPECRLWEDFGRYFLYMDQLSDAVLVFSEHYRLMLDTQGSRRRLHKGLPLVWLSDCFHRMGWPAHSQRYLMLTLCEDAVTRSMGGGGDVGGSRWRLVRREGLPICEFHRYLAEAQNVAPGGHALARFPEWVLQQLDQNWMMGPATDPEMQRYVTNAHYVRALLGGGKGPYGDRLEKLATYLLACMAGCRTAGPLRTYESDLDIACSLEVPERDFRSEFGRYFLCECKGRQSRAKRTPFTDFAKFCRVLDSVKCRFGILFAPQGISGEGKHGSESEASLRHQQKVFQDRGIVVVVIDRNDMEAVASGANFVTMLRQRYESVRLDLRPVQ